MPRRSIRVLRRPSKYTSQTNAQQTTDHSAHSSLQHSSSARLFSDPTYQIAPHLWTRLQHSHSPQLNNISVSQEEFRLNSRPCTKYTSAVKHSTNQKLNFFCHAAIITWKLNIVRVARHDRFSTNPDIVPRFIRVQKYVHGDQRSITTQSMAEQLSRMMYGRVPALIFQFYSHSGHFI